MAELMYITKNKSLPYHKPRIYFTGESTGFSKYFEGIKTELFARNDCVIWYTDPDVQPDEIEDYELRLKEMQLFVVPVTLRLLTEKNRTIDFDIPFAKENHIPILPLMQEYGLTDLFAEKIGDLQYLDKTAVDQTAIPYDEKLTAFLNKILIGDELSAGIRASFTAYIFLSYRKKDRKYAQELMRLIHQGEVFRDVAIWYDEFLVPGEDFNEAISEALKKSELVALAVTPNLINELNYVLSTEYPMALKLDKAILPAEMVPTDRKKLKKKYKKLPDIIDSSDSAALNARLYTVLGHIPQRERTDDPQHSFFIGLAYLSGIDVEINYERALLLISQAADMDFIPAIERLISMYTNGEGVNQDLGKAVVYQEKLVELLTEAFHSDPTEERAVSCAQAESDLFHMYESSGKSLFLQNAKKYTNAFDRYHKLLDGYKNYRLYEIVADFAILIGKLFEEIKDYDKAIEYYGQASMLISTAVMHGVGAVVCGDPASYSKEDDQKAFESVHISTSRCITSIDLTFIKLYHKTGNLQEAYDYGEKAIETAKELVKLTSSPTDKRLLATAYLRRSYTLKRQKNYDLSREFLEKAHELHLEIADETDSVMDRSAAACDGYDMARLYELKGDTKSAMSEFANTYSALKPIVKSGVLDITGHRFFAHTCIRIGDYLFDLHRFDEAEIYYTDAQKSLYNLKGTINIGNMMINILTKLGDIHLEQKRYDSFEKEYFYACKFIKSDPENENNAEMQSELADLRSKAGLIFSDLGEHMKARLWLLEAKQGYWVLNNEQEDSYYLFRLYLCSKAIAKGYEKDMNYDDAESQYMDAAEYSQRLVQLYDDVDDKSDLAEIYFSLSNIYFEQKCFNKHVDYLEKARQLYKKVIAEKPSYRNMMLYALCLGRLADEYINSYNNSQAVEAAGEAASVLESVIKQYPDDDSAAFQLARMYLIVGQITDERSVLLRALEIADVFPDTQSIAQVKKLVVSTLELL